MSAVATGIFILTGDNALPLTAFALAFSPVCPLSENDGKTTGNRLRLTRFPPLTPFLSPRSRLLRCLFPAHVREKTIFILTKRQHPRCAKACSNVFSSCCSFVFKVRFRGAKTNYMNFSNSARKTFLNVSLLSPRKNKKRCITSAMQRIFSFYVFTLCRPADNCAERIYDDKDECRHKDEQHL